MNSFGPSNTKSLTDKKKKKQKCPYCNGKGKITVVTSDFAHDFYKPCKSCNGKGFL